MVGFLNIYRFNNIVVENENETNVLIQSKDLCFKHICVVFGLMYVFGSFYFKHTHSTYHGIILDHYFVKLTKFQFG